MSGVILAYSALERFPAEARADLRTLVDAISGPLKLETGASRESTGLTGQQIGAVTAILDNIPAAGDTPAFARLRGMFNGPKSGVGTFVNNGHFHDRNDPGIDRGYDKARRTGLAALANMPGCAALLAPPASTEDAPGPKRGGMPGGKPSFAALTAG